MEEGVTKCVMLRYLGGKGLQNDESLQTIVKML